MGIYRHLTVEQLEANRDKLLSSLTERLTKPTSIGFEGRNVQFNQRTDEIRRELEAINVELDRRNGVASRAPIYIV
ncbi:MAG: hypothetical protein ACT6S0_25560 [Roseateles sp.]|uniref:hypothetical protein n=1 Tax=Roseateles sp. TaxID=1971397 RepID=UPI0040357F81